MRPNDEGLVLAPNDALAALSLSTDSVYSFLSDGRFIGPPEPRMPPVSDAQLDACRAVGSPGKEPMKPASWPFRIEMPSELADSGPDVSISTDTGYAPEGASSQALAHGATIRLALHRDTTRIAVNDGTHSTVLTLPTEVTDSLHGVGKCGDRRPALILRYDQNATPHLAADAC